MTLYIHTTWGVDYCVIWWYSLVHLGPWKVSWVRSNTDLPPGHSCRQAVLSSLRKYSHL